MSSKTEAAKPIKISDESFLEEISQPPIKQRIEITTRNVALLSDPSNLLYESMLRGVPEQFIRAEAYQAIGDKMTMPYPKREVN